MRGIDAKCVAVVLSAIAAAGCGSSDSGPTEGEKACQDLQAKYAQCSLTSVGACDTNEPCVVRCAANADCNELMNPSPTGPYVACVAACSGAGPDDFICADGKVFVSKKAICNGIAECPDKSDEAGCGADAGH